MAAIRTSQYKKKRQSLVKNLFCYFLTPLVCSLFWCSPFWIPLFSSSVDYLLSPRCVFIVANLIVFRLVGEKKVLTSSSSSSSSPSPAPLSEKYFEDAQRKSFSDDRDEEEMEKGGEGLEGESELLTLPDEELNKRVDDYIARVNELRRIEAKLLH